MWRRSRRHNITVNKALKTKENSHKAKVPLTLHSHKQYTVKRVPVRAFQQIQLLVYSILLYCPALCFLTTRETDGFIWPATICKYQSEKRLGGSRKRRRKRRSRRRGRQLCPEYRPTQTTADGQTDTKRDRQTDRQMESVTQVSRGNAQMT